MRTENFPNDPKQPIRQDPATGDFSSPDAMIVHAAFQDRYDWEPLDTLSSDHRLILTTNHLPTEKLRGGKRLVSNWKKGDLAAFTTAVDEQFRSCGLTDDESLTQMYRSLCKAVLTSAQKHIRFKAVGMTGEYW